MIDKIEEAKKLLEKEGYKITLDNKKEWLDVSDVIPETEVEIEVHDKDKSWDELKLSNKEDQLLDYNQVILLANSKYAKQLKMDGSSSKNDFFIKQPFNLNKKKGYVARFDAYSSYAVLDCNGDSDDSYSSLGVRFVRKKFLKNKK